jgi:chorismate mutase/prephenate dehydratase
MKKPVVLLVNGPNLDMLGKRDPAQYGTFTLADVEKAFAAKCAELGVEPRFFQSGCEGELCRAIHEAMGYAAGIVINAGAYTHYSYALLDALLLAKVPAMEVHISDIHSREPFRRISVIQPACVGQVVGLGMESYLVGLERLVRGHVLPDSETARRERAAAEDLGRIRTEIDRCDADLVALLRRRLDLSAQVAASKAETGKAVHDASREAAVVARARELATPAYAAAATAIMSAMMRISRERQYDVLMERGAEAFRAAAGLPARADGSLASVRRASFAGDAGSWSAAAAKALFPDAELLPARSFAEACDHVATGRTPVAVLPLANTTGGPVDTVYRLLRRNLHIVRSVDLEVRHCLAGVPGATPDGVRTVASHPQALAQCARAIHERGWATENAENTAFAAAAAARRGDPAFAAICSPEAARANGLEVLLENVCDTDVNATRFVAVSRELIVTPDASRLGLLLQLPDRAGALAAVLDLFVDRSLNLSSICSQPVPERPWEYAFFIDVNAPALDPAAIAAVYQLERELPAVRILGWYGG